MLFGLKETITLPQLKTGLILQSPIQRLPFAPDPTSFAHFKSAEE